MQQHSGKPTSINLKQVLDEITTLKLEYNANREKIFNKLQILTILPVSELNNAQVVMDQYLLDNLLSENVYHTNKIEQLSQLLSELKKESSKKVKREIKKSKEDPDKVDDKARAGIPFPTKILQTYGYVEVNEDGSKNVFSKQELDTNNFHILFRHFLESVAYPCMEQYGTVLPWNLVPVLSTPIAVISGPEDSSMDEQTYGNIASGKVVSNYPLCPGRPYREGDPICDRYQIKLYENAIVVCVTDGCNWGDKPRKAARIANKTILNYLHQNLQNLRSVTDTVHCLLASIADAQLAIINGEELNLPGATTALAGMMFEVDQAWVEQQIIKELNDTPVDSNYTTAPTNWVFVCANVGDCKVLHYSRASNDVRDITDQTRSNVLDPTDPGGRLGVYRTDLYPDIRNLGAFWHPVEEGDYIIAMSDGMYDNFDPQIQGLSPLDFDLDYKQWNDMPEYQALVLKQSYLVHFVADLLSTIPTLTPQDIQRTLTRYSVELCHSSREFLEQHPADKIPGDYNEYPGKLDHCTIACFRVGRVSEANRLNIPPPQVEPTHISIVRRRPSRLQKSRTVSEKNLVVQAVINDLAKVKPVESNSFVPGSIPIISTGNYSNSNNNSNNTSDDERFSPPISHSSETSQVSPKSEKSSLGVRKRLKREMGPLGSPLRSAHQMMRNKSKIRFND